MLIYALAAGALLFSFIFWPKLFDPTVEIQNLYGLSELGGQVNKFQTLIAGLLALAAGVITTFGIYLAAALPIRAANKKASEERDDRRVAGAAILAADLHDILSQLIRIRANEHRSVFVAPSRSERASIDISPNLRNLDVLATQTPEIVGMVSLAVLSANRVNHAERKTLSLLPGTAGMSELDDLRECINQALKDVKAALEALTFRDKISEKGTA